MTISNPWPRTFVVIALLHGGCADDQSQSIEIPNAAKEDGNAGAILNFDKNSPSANFFFDCVEFFRADKCDIDIRAVHVNFPPGITGREGEVIAVATAEISGGFIDRGDVDVLFWGTWQVDPRYGDLVFKLEPDHIHVEDGVHNRYYIDIVPSQHALNSWGGFALTVQASWD